MVIFWGTCCEHCLQITWQSFCYLSTWEAGRLWNLILQVVVRGALLERCQITFKMPSYRSISCLTESKPGYFIRLWHFFSLIWPWKRHLLTRLSSLMLKQQDIFLLTDFPSCSFFWLLYSYTYLLLLLFFSVSFLGGYLIPDLIHSQF